MVKRIGWIAPVAMAATLMALLFFAAGLTAQPSAGAADCLQPQKAFGVRSGMQEMSHESRAGEADDLPGYKYLHGMPRNHREGQAFDSEARRICQLQAGGSLGSCLYRAARRRVESPRTYRSRSKMRDVPRAGSRDGGDVGSHERYDDV